MLAGLKRETIKDRQFVTALARGLDILRAFRPGESHLTNSELAARTKLPRPTISRLTHTLTTLGYLVYEDAVEKYRLGGGVLALGYVTIANLDIRHVARPFMQEIADFARSACALGDSHDLGMIYVENCRGKDAPFTLGLDIGSRIPLAGTAMGRAYIAGLPAAKRDALCKRLAKEHGKDWPRLHKRLLAALADFRRDGFVTSIADWTPEINAVGVPIVFEESGTVMALNCGGAASLLTADFLNRKVGPRLAAAARQIETLLRHK
jgi:DNA-binding IclR family transcriptional regulator